MPRKKTTKAAFDKVTLEDLMGQPDVEATIKQRLPILLQRAFDLAEGVLFAEVKQDPKTGEYSQRIYQTTPDRQMLQFLMEHVIGRSPQRIEVTGKDGKPMEIIPWMPVAAAEAAGLLIEAKPNKALKSGEAVTVEGIYSVVEEPVDVPT